MERKNYKIKQILPVPDNVSAVIRVEGENGEECFVDVSREGWIVLLALVEDEDGNTNVLPYTLDAFEALGEIHDNSDVCFRPARHCKKCGRKMWVSKKWVSKRPVLFDRFGYVCECGEVWTPPR